MTAVKKMSKEVLKDIRVMLKDSFDAIEKKHGIKAEFGRIKYSDSEAHGKMTLSVLSPISSQEKEKIRKAEFSLHAKKYGFKKSYFGRTFSFDSLEYIITGVNPKGRVNNILAKVKIPVRGKQTEYIFNTQDVIHALKAQDKA